MELSLEDDFVLSKCINKVICILAFKSLHFNVIVQAKSGKKSKIDK